MASAACVACARPIFAATPGHGYYRRRASDCVVTACSVPCASVGMMFALIGMPAQKRSADDAELENPAPKEPTFSMDVQRRIDYDRVAHWRDMMYRAIVDMDGDEDALTSDDIKQTLLPIAARIQVSKSDMHMLLDPVLQALDELLVQIKSPPARYDMDSISQMARRIIARMQRMEMTENLARAGALDSDSYLSDSQFPADIRNLAARFLQQALMPTTTVSFDGHLGVATVGKNFIYLSDNFRMEKIDVTTFNGHHVKTIPNVRELTSVFEPPDPLSTGELWALRYGWPGESDTYRRILAILVSKEDYDEDVLVYSHETDWSDDKNFTIDVSSGDVLVGNISTMFQPYSKIAKYSLSRDGSSGKLATYQIPRHIFGPLPTNNGAGFSTLGSFFSEKLMLSCFTQLPYANYAWAIIDLTTQTYRRYYLNTPLLCNFTLVGPHHIAVISEDLKHRANFYYITIAQLDALPSTGPHQLMADETVDKSPPVITDVFRYGRSHGVANAKFAKAVANIDRLHVVDRSIAGVKKTTIRSFLLD